MANTTGKKFGGRKKGTPNKVTATVKEVFMETFDKMGGVPRMIAWADEEPAEFYKLYARLIPTEAKVDLAGELNVTLLQFNDKK